MILFQCLNLLVNFYHFITYFKDWLINLFIYYFLGKSNETLSADFFLKFKNLKLKCMNSLLEINITKLSNLSLEDNSVLSLIDECEKKIRELTLNFDLIKEFEKLALI